MARTTKPLTNTEVKSAKARDKEYTLSDGEGLQLRVRANGTKNWFLNYYRPHTKKRAIIGLGQYPNVSLADARKVRGEYRALIAKVIAPQVYRSDGRMRLEEAHHNTL